MPKPQGRPPLESVVVRVAQDRRTTLTAAKEAIEAYFEKMEKERPNVEKAVAATFDRTGRRSMGMSTLVTAVQVHLRDRLSRPQIARIVRELNLPTDPRGHVLRSETPQA